MSDSSELVEAARRISAYQIALELTLPSTRRVGPFYARFDLGDPNPFANYAIPQPGAAPSSANVADLVEAYLSRARKPRLEYIAASAPAVESALLTAGFVAEDRPPLMACTPGAEKQLPPPAGIILVTPSSDGDLLAVSAVQREAFGGDPALAGPADVEGMRADIGRGLIAVLAREESTGEPAGAGVCTPLHDAVTEIAGIAVPKTFRRRGIAAAMTAWLATASFDKGATLAWLTPGGEEAQRIYARAGFEPCGEMLMISLAS